MRPSLILALVAVAALVATVIAVLTASDPVEPAADTPSPAQGTAPPAPTAVVPASPNPPPAQGKAAPTGLPRLDCRLDQGDVARVDGKGLPARTLCADLQRTAGAQLTPESPEPLHQQARAMLDLAIDAVLIEAALASDRVEVKPEDIDAAVHAMYPQSDLPGAATPGALLAQQLKREGLDAEVAREQIRRRVAIRKLVEERGNLAVTDAEVRAAYDADPRQWALPAAVKVEPYLAPVPPRADEAAATQAEADARTFAQAAPKGDAKRLATELRLRALPAFDLVAKGVEPALEQAGLALADGAWSPPVRTKTGWVVLHAIGHTPEKPRPFEEVREEIRTRLTHQRRATEQTRLLAVLRAAAKIERLLEP